MQLASNTLGEKCAQLVALNFAPQQVVDLSTRMLEDVEGTNVFAVHRHGMGISHDAKGLTTEDALKVRYHPNCPCSALIFVSSRDRALTCEDLADRIIEYLAVH
jgi:hypothetical protein